MMSGSGWTLRMERFPLQWGLKPLKVIYQLDFRHQLLITATHIWIYMPFVSQFVLLTAIIISVLLYAQK